MPAFLGFSGLGRDSKTDWAAAFGGGIVKRCLLVTASGSPLTATIDVRAADKFRVQGAAGRLASNVTIALTNIGTLASSSVECEYTQIAIEIAIGATAPVITFTADGGATIYFDRTFTPSPNETEIIVADITSAITGSVFPATVKLYSGNGAAA